MANILLTRAAAENEAMQAEIAALGFEPIMLPVLDNTPKSVDFLTLQNFTNIIITSKFAAGIIAENLTWSANFFVVGENSAKIIAQNNMANIAQIFSDVGELQEYLAAHNADFLYLCGNVITQELSGKITKQEIYKTQYIQEVKARTLEIIKTQSIDNIVLYSENSAKQLGKLIRQYNLLQYVSKSVVIALSEKVAAAIDFTGNIHVCQQPSQQSMLQLLQDYGRR